MARAIKSDVQALLEPYAERLAAIATEAWRDWMTSGRQHWRTKRSRASFVWEEMIERAHHAFLGDTLHARRQAQACLWLERWVREEFGRQGAARLGSALTTVAADGSVSPFRWLQRVWIAQGG